MGVVGQEKDHWKDVAINLSTMESGRQLKLKDINHLSKTFFLEDDKEMGSGFNETSRCSLCTYL